MSEYDKQYCYAAENQNELVKSNKFSEEPDLKPNLEYKIPSKETLQSVDTYNEPATKNKKKYYCAHQQNNFLKDIKKLLKIKNKSKRKSECCCKIQVWEKHDCKCLIENKEFSYVGELFFPVCSKDVFYHYPGVPIRKSQKSYTINDPDKFRKPGLEERLFAYPEKVIPLNLLEDSDSYEVDKWEEPKIETQDKKKKSFFRN